MANWNTGSFIAQVHIEIPDVPERISGTNMTNTIDMARLRVQRYTGATLSLSSVDEKYIPPILHFTCANVLSSMELEGTDAASVTIGEFTLNKGKTSSAKSAADDYLVQANEELKDLGTNINYRQSL
ncbi:MAG: hypothetical protein WC444_06805 [Candidatus Paceibacterota bacterium]